MLPASTTGSTLKRGTTDSVKVYLSDPRRDTDPEQKSEQRADRSQSCGLRGKESVQQPAPTRPEPS